MSDAFVPPKGTVFVILGEHPFAVVYETTGDNGECRAMLATVLAEPSPAAGKRRAAQKAKPA